MTRTYPKPHYRWRTNPDAPAYDCETLGPALRAAGCVMEASTSRPSGGDLYVRHTPEADTVLTGYRFRANVTAFADVDGAVWLDVPFVGWLAHEGNGGA